jgi:hypothetical protein
MIEYDFTYKERIEHEKFRNHKEYLVKCLQNVSELDKVQMTNYLWEPVFEKELYCFNLIKKNISFVDEVSIIGCRFPYNYVYNMSKLYNCKFNIIDYHPHMEKWCNKIFEFADVDYYKKRPLFDNLNTIIKNSDMIIFPETEYLVPFKMMNYDLKGKNVLYVNSGEDPNYMSNNIVNSKQEMEEMCDCKSYIKGTINKNIHYLLKVI